MACQDRGGTHCKGEIGTIPEAVGKKEEGPENPVLFRHLQNPLCVGL